MSKATYAAFSAAVFVGLFFVFSVLYGVDPTDLSGTFLNVLVPAVIPASVPYVAVAGVALTVVGFLGLMRWVREAWEKSWARGVAVLMGLLAGGLTLTSPGTSVWFWLGGLLVIYFH